MASSSATVEYFTGKVYWAKILGAPRLNFNKDGKEWAFEFEPDEAGLAILKKHKLLDRLKDKHEDRPKFLVLRKRELNAQGELNPPIRIVDAEGKEWDSNKLLGNETVVDLKLDIRDYGPGKKKGIYPVAIRVQSLVPYESSEFGAMDKDKPQNAAAASVESDFASED